LTYVRGPAVSVQIIWTDSVWSMCNVYINLPNNGKITKYNYVSKG